jgi:Holliday junction resolvase
VHDPRHQGSISFKGRGGRASRQKGNRTERALVRYLQERGLAADRMPLSGSAGGRYSGDLTVPVLGLDHRVEVKVRANGFQRLYEWLNGADLLIVRADRKEPLIVVPLRLATEVAAVAEGHKAGDCHLGPTPHLANDDPPREPSHA